MLWPPGEVDHTAIQDERLNFCPRLALETSDCFDEGYKLRNWFKNFYQANVLRNGAGGVVGNTFLDKEYSERAFGWSICDKCLHGIPGSEEEVGESCNATFYPGE